LRACWNTVCIRKSCDGGGRAGCGAGCRATRRCVVRDLRLVTVFAVLCVGCGLGCPGFGGC
jgi:hypothetical protein